MVGAGVVTIVHLGAVTHLLTNLLRHLLHDDPGDSVAHLLGDGDTDLLGDLLLHVDRILSADCLGELFAFFAWNIDREVLTAFVRNFLAFCSWH